MPRYFTLDQAEALIPDVENVLREACRAKAAYDQAESELETVQSRIRTQGGVRVDGGRMLALQAQRQDSAVRLKAVIEKIQEIGCQLKDLETGLIDFPTLFRGAEVCLCWKLGEKQIRFWHDTEEGFRGRKPIDRDFLDHHRGDPAN